MLLVDRQPSELAAAVDCLIAAGWRVRTVDDCHAACCAIVDRPPEVILLGRLSRYLLRSEHCRLLRAAAPRPGPRILVLSPAGAERTRARCLAEGADGFLDSLDDPRAILGAIRGGAAGIAPPSRAILVHGEIRMDLERLKVSAGDRTIALRPSAFRLLRTFLEQPGAILSREALLAALRAPGKVKARTVDSHVRTLRAALAAAGLGDIISTVRDAGYSLVEATPGAGPNRHHHQD